MTLKICATTSKTSTKTAYEAILSGFVKLVWLNNWFWRWQGYVDFFYYATLICDRILTHKVDVGDVAKLLDGWRRLIYLLSPWLSLLGFYSLLLFTKEDGSSFFNLQYLWPFSSSYTWLFLLWMVFNPSSIFALGDGYREGWWRTRERERERERGVEGVRRVS